MISSFTIPRLKWNRLDCAPEVHVRASLQVEVHGRFDKKPHYSNDVFPFHVASNICSATLGHMVLCASTLCLFEMGRQSCQSKMHNHSHLLFTWLGVEKHSHLLFTGLGYSLPCWATLYRVGQLNREVGRSLMPWSAG